MYTFPLEERKTKVACWAGGLMWEIWIWVQLATFPLIIPFLLCQRRLQKLWFCVAVTSSYGTPCRPWVTMSSHVAGSRNWSTVGSVKSWSKAGKPKSSTYWSMRASTLSPRWSGTMLVRVDPCARALEPSCCVRSTACCRWGTWRRRLLWPVGDRDLHIHHRPRGGRTSRDEALLWRMDWQRRRSFLTGKSSSLSSSPYVIM